MKRLLTLAMTLALVACMPLTALADTGVWGSGGLSDTTTAYGFDGDLPMVVYNNEVDTDPDWENIYPGSAIYFPLITGDDASAWTNATDKQVKDDAVKVSYKATKGSQYINSVSLVNITKEKLKNAPSGTTGMWLKIQVSDSYASTRSANVILKLVLSVNKVSYQETELELGFDLVNRTVYIDRDSVYGARVPTMFEADYYSGEATFDMGGGVLYTARVKDGQKYVINYSTDPESAVADRNPTAYMEFHRFLGSQDTFAAYGSLEIPISSSDFQDENGKATLYVYEIDGDQLIALDSDVASYKSGILTIRAKTLGEYVLSSASLLRDASGGDSGDVLQSGYASQQGDAVSSSAAAPTTPTPTGTGAGAISADNVSAGNPVTGADGMLPAMTLTALLAAGVALLVVRKWKIENSRTR